MFDPFQNCRCTDCGWVHYPEHDCPLEPPRNLEPLQRRGYWINTFEVTSS